MTAPLPTIKDLTTRELVAARMRYVRYLTEAYLKIFDNFDNFDESTPIPIGKRTLKGGVVHTIIASKNELRAELAGRPHIPNTAEAKRLRQCRAKQRA